MKNDLRPEGKERIELFLYKPGSHVLRRDAGKQAKIYLASRMMGNNEACSANQSCNENSNGKIDSIKCGIFESKYKEEGKGGAHCRAMHAYTHRNIQ